jgi:ABC-type dipeptide/oligopeptide/nickel transport system ATPase component
MTQPLLEITDLHVEVATERGPAEILHGVSARVESGKMLGLVGETGSGKSMTALAAIGLLPRGATVTRGSAVFDGRDLTTLGARELRALRGADVSMVFQNPRTALYPMATVESQMSTVVRSHEALSRKALRDRIRNALTLVGIPDADRVAKAYPHHLSGGLAQRVVIATSLICEPRLLIADEPTTGLDVTVQIQILGLLEDLQQRLGLAVVMITHDLGIVAHACDTVSVMRDGRIVESGDKRSVLGSPQHEYTRLLIAASRLRPKEAVVGPVSVGAR